MEAATALRALYDQYAKSGFVADAMGDEAADIHTERRTEGTSRDAGGGVPSRAARHR